MILGFILVLSFYCSPFWILDFSIFYQKVEVNIPIEMILDIITLYMLFSHPLHPLLHKVMVVETKKWLQTLNCSMGLLKTFTFYKAKGT